MPLDPTTGVHALPTPVGEIEAPIDIKSAEPTHESSVRTDPGARVWSDSDRVGDDSPIPLTRTIPIPDFPVDSLPEAIADMVQAVGEATQTDPAMAGTSALSALAACAGGHAEIEVRRGWREPLCIYAVTIAAPGERKSAVQMMMTRPLIDVEGELVAKGLAARSEAETRKQIATKAAERQRNAAANAEGIDREVRLADAIGAAALADAIEVPAIPRLLADDITAEAAGTVLAEQNGRLAIISAEGGVFDIIAGRYSKLPNMDLWLKGHSGDPVKVDRKGRPPEHIRRPALTLGLMIQPSVLDGLAGNREFRGRGLLARFLYAFPQSKVGRRQIAPPPVSDEIQKAYSANLTRLASGLVGWASDPAVLILSEEAKQAITAIEQAVEPTLAGDGELAQLADWGAKFVGAVARITGILHLALHGPDAGVRTPIAAATVHAAHRVGSYYKACATRAFAEMGADALTSDAIYLLHRIKQLNESEFSERDMHVATQSRFKTKDALQPALSRLVDHGYLQPLPVEPTGGRPASPRYAVVQT
jgi:replicative DNA helicase